MTRVAVLAGDGIGPEVMREGTRVLQAVLPGVELDERLLGGTAIAAEGDPLPPATLEACIAADAVLMGAVGASDYSWRGRSAEEGMFELRRALDVYANLRPFQGLGERGTRADGTVFDTCEYHPDQVERIVRTGFELAAARGGRLTSVDKANVLATSRLWRETAERLAPAYPEVTLDHMLVDTAAMKLVQDPTAFDVIVTENTFGDILSDVAAALTGGLGEAASACLGARRPGLFEPVHGTAPDIAGRGVANPTAMIRTVAMLLEQGLDLSDEALRVNEALDRASARVVTPDRGGSATTSDVGDAVLAELGRAGCETRGADRT